MYPPIANALDALKLRYQEVNRQIAGLKTAGLDEKTMLERWAPLLQESTEILIQLVRAGIDPADILPE